MKTTTKSMKLKGEFLLSIITMRDKSDSIMDCVMHFKRQKTPSKINIWNILEIPEVKT